MISYNSINHEQSQPGAFITFGGIKFLEQIFLGRFIHPFGVIFDLKHEMILIIIIRSNNDGMRWFLIILVAGFQGIPDQVAEHPYNAWRVHGCVRK